MAVLSAPDSAARLDTDLQALASLAAEVSRSDAALIGLFDRDARWSSAYAAHTRAPGEPASRRRCAAIVAGYEGAPATAGSHGFERGGVPLRSTDGALAGVLCVARADEREPGAPEVSSLERLARLAESLLELRRTGARLRLVETAMAQMADAVSIYRVHPPSFAPLIERVYANAPAGGEIERAAAPEEPFGLAIERDRAVSYALVRRRADGAEYVAETTVSPIRDRHGRTTHWTKIERDITARLSAEGAFVRARAAEAANAELSHAVERHRRAAVRLHAAATRDDLTGLANRASFVLAVENALERARASGRAVAALAFIDLDRFKSVNDRLGHSAGDELLRLVGARLQDVLRPGDLLARYGGDEFTVLIDDVDRARMNEIAERLGRALGAPFLVAGEEARVGSSVGVAMIDSHYTNVAEIVHDADLAMYRIKAKAAHER